MKALRRVWARVRGVFSRGDDAIAQELAAHLDLATDDYIRQGLSPDEARRRARIDAGSLDAAAEAYRDQRSVPVVDSLLRDLRFATKGLRRNPRFGVGILTSLALGIGLNTAIFTVVDSVLRRPLPYPDADRLVAIGSLGANETGEIDWTSYPNTIMAWQHPRSLDVAAMSSSHQVIAGTAGAEFAVGANVTPNLLTVLGARPALGRWFTQEELRSPVVVLSDAVWRRQFAADSAVPGKILHIDGRPYTVIGVMPRGVGLPLGSAYWIPMEDPWGRVIGRVHKGVSVATADAELTQLSPTVAMYKKREGKTIDVVVMPLHDQLYGSARLSLWLLLGAAALLLLITCANVTNLSLARALDRRREFAMRVSLGATRASVGSLLVIENLLLALGGAAAGLALAWLGTGFLVSLAPPSITLAGDIRVRGTQVVFAALLAVIACLLVSVAPVMDTTRISIGLGQVGARISRGRGMRRVRQSLVAVQLALTLLLMTGAGLLLRSVAQLTRADHLGFNPEGVVVLNVSPIGDRYQDRAVRLTFVRDLMVRLRTIPGVQLVSSGPPPLVAGNENTVREGFNSLLGWAPPGHPENARTIWQKNVDPDYRAVYDIPIALGRWFTASDDSGAARVAMINKEAARLFFGNVDPIGRQLPLVQLSRNEPAPVVVGVVNDVLQRDLSLTANPEIYLPVAQQPAITFAMLSVKSSAPPAATAAAIQRQLRTTNPDLAAARLQPMTDVVAASLARHTFVLRLLGLFAALGLVLSVIGLYAIVSYLVTQRTAEIGVRLALGAPRTRVFGMVVGEAGVLAVLGVAIGAPLTLAMARVLSSFLFEVKTTDVLSYTLAPLILAVVALAAAYAPARRASRVDPAIALRAE